MTNPKTYRSAQIQEKDGDLVIINVDWKDPTFGEVMVKVEACGVCHSDSIVAGQHMPTGLPRVPGHEIVGIVAAVPESEKRWKVGDRVGSGWHGGHDLTCGSCLRGDFVTCDNEAINGISRDGGYSEYCILRTEALLSIPTDIDAAEAAPLLCAGVTTFNSLRNMDVRAGDVVAVQGVGGLGHLAIQFAAKMGFHTVALSGSASKEKLAKELGAQTFIDGSKVNTVEELQKLGGAKVVIAVAPSGKAMSDLIPALAVGGQLVVLAIAEPLSVPITPIVQKRLQVRGWPSGAPIDSQDTVAFAKLAGIKCMVEKFPLDKVNEAYKHMMSGDVRFRAVLTFD